MMRSFTALAAGLRQLFRTGAGRIICIVTLFSVAAASTGCSRGYISAYSDNLSRSSCSMTAVSADFSGFTALFAEDFAVPGEGGKAEAGDVFAAGLFDLQDGKTVVEENLTKRLYPASITKIMTALLAVKYGDMDEMLTASARVPEMEWEAQKIGIEKGDRMTLEQALNYLLVYSANDAAVLIAENIGKDYDDFIRMMNEEAARIGATNTHFVNPHGLHDPEHYTTAYDLYLIFRECLKYPEFRKLMHQDYYSTIFHDKDGNMRAIEVPSTDFYLLGTASAPAGISVAGGKTGTTDQAGNCLIILSENSQGREFISVILGATGYDELYVCMNRLLRLERGYTGQ